MPQKLDDFNKIESIRYSINVVSKRIKQLESYDPIFNSSAKKRQSLLKLKESLKKMEEELEMLKSDFLDYIKEISQDPCYSFCDPQSQQILIAHYYDGKTWTKAIGETDLYKSVRNFSRDVRDKIIVTDYSK